MTQKRIIIIGDGFADLKRSETYERLLEYYDFA